MPDPNYVQVDDAIFLLPAKCANTSVKQALLQRLGAPVDTSCPGWFVRIHNADRLPYVGVEAVLSVSPATTVVGIVRDPVDRMVSLWRDKVAGVPVLEFLRPCGMRAGMPWPEFVEVVCATGDDQADQHWRSLCADLIVAGQRPDVILRMERLADDWAFLEQRLGWPRVGMPHLNAANGAPRVDPTPAERDAIYRRYANDCYEFGYP